LNKNKVNKTASGKATGGLVQQGIAKSGAENFHWETCSSVEICILVESFRLVWPAIAKPRDVSRNY
jgi:hypothetical protein